MQSKISFNKRLLFFVGIAGIVFSSLVIFFLILSPLVRGSYTKLTSPVSNESPQDLISDKSAEFIRSGPPIRLKIPKINVDAAVEYVGRTSNGKMDIPKSLDNVAWFKLGARPGGIGSSVIAGHYGWRNGKTAVFDKLYKLSKGDEIYVEDEDGSVTTFVVRESRKYDPDADASDVFGSNNGTAHLNLVTCAGDWDEVSQTFSKRLVVFTDKE